MSNEKNNAGRKVLLIVPPVILRKDRPNFNVNFPMGLGYLAAVLRQAEYEVEILDTLVEKINQRTPLPGRKGHYRFGMTQAEIREAVIACNPDFVGVTSMFTKQFDSTRFICDIVKDVAPKVPVIVGGAHATADAANVISEKSVDYVVSGEGEGVIVPLLKAIADKAPVAGIPNISFRNPDGTTTVKPVTIYADVNALPFPERALFPMEKYFLAMERHGNKLAEGTRSASLLTSRGCPFRCNFCSAYDVFGRRVRIRSAESVMAEIDELVGVYRANDVYLTDDQFLADKTRVMEILDGIISRNYGITFDAPNGLSPWLLSDELLGKMKQAGFWRINIAIESGNEWVLKNIVNKPVKLDTLPELMILAKKHGLVVQAFLVVGNVSENAVETFEQIRDSFALMRKLGVHFPTVSYLSPHIGSTAYDVAVQKGYLDKSYEDSDYDRPVITTPLWTKAELEQFVTIQLILCSVQGHLLLWPVKLLALEWAGFLVKQRHALLFFLYSRLKGLIKMFRSLAHR